MPVGPPKPRRQEPTETVASGTDNPADWYAVTEDGESALRIAPGLTIGETANGALALNDRNPERQWLVFELDDADGYTVGASAEGWRLADAGTAVPPQRLHYSLTLALPNNTLRISTSIVAPAPGGRRLEVVTQTDLDALARARSAEVTVPPAVTARRPPESAPQARRTPLSRRIGAVAPRNRSVIATGTGLALVVGAAGWWFWSASSGPAAVPLAEPVVDVPVPAGPGPALLPTVLQTQPTTAGPPGPADPATAGLAPVSSSVGLVAPVIVPDLARRSVPPPAPRPDPVLAARLALAQALLDSGRVTYPPKDNAVAVLVGILSTDPGNDAAMELLGVCTNRLIDDATAARAAGDDYAARNILEEVFGFNPQHPGAHALWEAWVGAPRAGQFGARRPEM